MAKVKSNYWLEAAMLEAPEDVQRNIKKQFNLTRKNSMELSGTPEWDDMDQKRFSRRLETCQRTVYQAKEMVKDVYPDFPETSNFERDWGYLNSNINMSYDALDRKHDLILAASLWILDTIANSELGALYWTEKYILPEMTEQEAENMPSWMIGEDSYYDEALVMKVVYVLQHRNDDCCVYRKKSDKVRYILDDATVQNKHLQDVPSRHRFENLLSVIPPEAIDDAVHEFEEKYWQLARIFFASLQENSAKRDALIHSHDRLVKKREPYSNSNEITFPLEYLISQNKIADKPKISKNVQTFIELTNAISRCEEAVQACVDDKQDFAALFPEYYSMTEDIRHEMMPKAFVEGMKAFHISDPYKMCFALLYLADRGDDLIWNYFFGTALMAMTADTLPWRNRYDEFYLDQLHEEHEKTAAEETFFPYEMIYEDGIPEDSIDREARNLAQLLYEYTGVIPPRNLRVFDWADTLLEKDGVPGDMRKTLRLCMSLIDALSRQYRGSFKEQPQPETVLPADNQDPSQQISQLEQQIRQLTKENKQMRDNLWNMQSQNVRLSQKLEQSLHEGKADREELARLREVLFADQNPQKETPDPSIVLPYETQERIVICGGHDSFLKQFTQLITGNVRTLNNVRVNDELIRNASEIWIQTNAISHSEYYKILNLCRKNDKPVHYFQYASARKCAEQIVKSR